MASKQEKMEIVDDVVYKYSTSWIYSLESELHWRYYWQQQKLIQNLVKPGQHLLEIGVGSGFTANYLRSKGISVTTIDIDAEKEPDIVANIVTYNFSHKYDHVLAFEVFEHIPFVEFQKVIQRLSTVCQRYLFLSVPRSERVWLRSELLIPILGQRFFEIITLRKEVTEEHHFWEVDDGTVSKHMFEQALSNAGYHVDCSKKVFSRLFYALASSNFTFTRD